MNEISFAIEAESLLQPLSYTRRLWSKRLFDIAFSLSVLIIASPMFLTISLLIRLASAGRAVYAQERVGKNGRLFRCYKFRTMYKDADARLFQLLKNRPDLQKEWDENHKLRFDPRITGKLGHFLRKTSLDELPQFWNVLKGDLSVVGPRPRVVAEIQQHLKSKAPKILSMRPGLTGIWQTSGRSDFIDYERRISMDEQYIDDHSLWLDLWLIAKTIPCMIFSRGA